MFSEDGRDCRPDKRPDGGGRDGQNRAGGIQRELPPMEQGRFRGVGQAEEDLPGYRKGDTSKVAMARRLRQETNMILK